MDRANTRVEINTDTGQSVDWPWWLLVQTVCFSHLYSTAQLVRGCTLSYLTGEPWSQMSSLLFPGTSHHFCRASHFSALCSPILLTHALTLSARHFLRQKNSVRARTCTRRDLDPRPKSYQGRHSPIIKLQYNIKIKIHTSCEIEYFVETHLRKLCVILRSRVLRVVCPH